MKKIFTLLVSVGLLTAAAQAQPGSRNDRDKPQYDQQRNTPQTERRDDRQFDQRNNQQSQQTDQWDKDRTYSDQNKDTRYDVKTPGYGKGIQMQENQINRKYDLKIQQVKRNFWMRSFEKSRQIRFLEMQRQQELRMLYQKAGNRYLYDRDNKSNW